MLQFTRRSAIVARVIAPVMALTVLVPAAFTSSASAESLVPGSTTDTSAVSGSTVTPLGWSVVGLDSNNVNVGPDEFPVGARYCASTLPTSLTAHWQWLGTGSTTNNSLIALADSVTATYETITSFSPQTGIVAGKTCYDAYWNVKVRRTSAAYDVDRGYQITFSDGASAIGSTDNRRRIYVEKLVSQNRNTVGTVSLDGGGTTLTAGKTYDFTVTGSTSTSYDQLTFASIFPAPTFQLLDAHYTYSTATGLASDGYSDQTYNDSCLWQYMYDVKEEPGQCVGVGGSGGNITAHFTVKVAPNASGATAINTLIYDFSGSSFHYNSDYGVGGKSFSFTIVQPASYSVTYHGNHASFSGSVPATATGISDGASYTVESMTAGTAAGYVFVGWNTLANGTGTAYKFNDTLTVNSNVDLYAVWVPVTYWILAYNPMGGTGGPDTGTVYPVADSGTVRTELPSKTGYIFAGWATSPYSGTSYAGNDTYTSPGIETMIVLYAQWTAQRRSVTYDPNTSKCSIVTGSVYEDTSTLVTSPYAILGNGAAALQYSCTGGTFSGWNTSSNGTGTTYPPNYSYTGTGPLTLYAQWTPNPVGAYIVTYFGNGNTVGTAPVNANTYASGATTPVSTQADLGRSGYYFSGWTTNADGSGAFYWPGAALTFTDHDITLYARWLPNPNVFTLVVKTVGSGSVSPAGGNYVESLNVPVTATPATGWKFTGWSGDCSGTASAFTVVMNSDKICTATFVPLEYKLTTSTVGSGSVTPGATYTYGAMASLTATPAKGWHFTGWSGDCSGTANPTTVTMTSDKSCIANFAIDVLPLATDTKGSGSVTPGGSYKYGETTTITATPAPGWKFTGWTGDCTGTTNPLTIVMDAAKSCTANFEQIIYPLTTEPKGSGTVTPGGNFKSGDTVTLTATPAAGWKFTGWSGACSGTTNPLTIVMDAAKACTANFEQIIYPLTVNTAGQGSVSPASGSYKSGDKVTITATPADGWKFTGWSGACSGTENPTTVTMDAAKECTATFEEIPVVKNDVYKTSLNTTLKLPAGASILGNDTAGLGKVALATKTKHGTITLAPNGKLTYKPNTGFVGVDSFKYKAYDAKGKAYVATVKIIVTPKVPKDITTGH